MRRFLIIPLIIFAISLFTDSAYSQARHIYKVDPSGFPTVKAHIVAKNRVGTNLNIDRSHFSVVENGVDLSSTVQIDSTKRADTPGVSVLLLINFSATMQYDMAGGTKLEVAKDAARAFVDSIKFKGGTEVAVMPFQNGNKQPTNPGFLKDPAKIYQNIDNIGQDISEAHYRKAFLGPAVNVFDMFKFQANNDIPNHIVMISDGPSTFDFTQADGNNIVAQAQAAQVVVHSVSIDSEVDFEVDQMIKGTGGKSLFGFNKSDAISKTESIVNDIQRVDYYELTWQSPFGCSPADFQRSAVIEWSDALGDVQKTKEVSYTLPEASLATFDTDKEAIFFGSIEGDQNMKTISITNNGPAFEFQGVEFDPDTDFEVDNWGGTKPPFAMAAGETRQVTIRYDDAHPPTESNLVNMTFTGDGFPCDFPTVSLISLCMGEAAETFDFGDVPEKTDKTETIECAFTNNTAAAIVVTAEVLGDNSAEFEIIGSNEFNVEAGECLDLEVKFSPVDQSEKNAYVEFTMPADCGGSYTMDLSGMGIINSIEEEYAGAANGLKINVNPNPAGNMTNINFSTENAGMTRIELYNSMGQLVETLLNKSIEPGTYNSTLETSAYPNGVYILRIVSGQNVASKKVIISR